MTAPRTDTTIPPVVPTPAPLTPPIDPSGNVDTTSTGENSNQLFMQALREKEQENLRLKSLLEQQQRTPAVKDEVDQWESFTGAPRDLIAQEVDRAVAPLNTFIANLQREGELTKLKKVFRTDPMYAKVLDSAEHYVDQVLASVNPLSVQAVEFAISSVAGAIATGKLKIPGLDFGTTLPTPSPIVSPRNPVTPPHIPPSSTPLPQDTNVVVGDRELTETERRFAKMSGMTDAEFLKGLQGDAVTAKKQKEAK